jgi:hypothetical protein
MKTYEEWMYRATYFFTSVQVGGEWSASHSGLFILGERAQGTYWIGGLVSPRNGLDYVEERKFFILDTGATGFESPLVSAIPGPHTHLLCCSNPALSSGRPGLMFLPKDRLS